MNIEKWFSDNTMAKVDIVLGLSILFSLLINASGVLPHGYVMYYNLLIFAQLAALLLYHAAGWIIES